MNGETLRFSDNKNRGLAEVELSGRMGDGGAPGEERIWVDGAVCGLLLESIPSVLAILKTWFPERFPTQALPRIEVISISDALDEPGERPAVFYPGGVDSTHLLLANAQDFPVGHPNRIEYGICVYGCDMGGQIGHDGSKAINLLLSQSRPLLDALSVRQLPVYTNLRHLDDRPGFWGELFESIELKATLGCVLQKKLVIEKFPALARLPIDRNTFDDSPLIPSMRSRLRDLFRPWRLRVIEQRLGLERRLYHRVMHPDNELWRELRQIADRAHGGPLDRELIRSLLPAPDAAFPLPPDPFAGMMGRRALIQLLISTAETD